MNVTKDHITKDRWVKIAAIIISALLAVAAVLGWYLPVEVPEERAVRERIAIDARADSYLYNGADLYVYSDDHATQKFHVDGATGDMTGAGDFIVSAQTAISVTAEGGVILPTGTYQPLESAANFSSTLSTSGFTAGTLLVLVNTTDHRLAITDTTTSKLSGNLFLDQYDSAILWFDGTNWIQIGESDN